MKLKPGYVTEDIDGVQILVPVGEDAFCGIVRSNRTAAFIVDCLKEETTPEAIADAMLARYDAPRETVAADVAEILGKLRSIGALAE